MTDPSKCLIVLTLTLGLVCSAQAADGGSGLIGDLLGLHDPMSVVFLNKDGKEVPVRPLPVAKKVAVWPGDKADVLFADKIGRSFDVTSPGVVAAILADAGVNQSLKGASDSQLVTNFGMICDKTQSDLVFASRLAGISAQGLKTVVKGDLFGFSCANKTIVWTDLIAIIAPGGVRPEDTPALDELTSTEWARRIVDAEALGRSRIVR